MNLLKRIAAKLPNSWQNELKRHYFAKQIRQGRFLTNEPDFIELPKLLKAGDWAIDVGANIGHYTRRMSDLVGSGGRVLAFEPVPETFALLAANVYRFTHRNVTLLNAAASNATALVSMSIPDFDSGLQNFYQAHLLAAGAKGGLDVLTIGVDALRLPRRVALIKIDAEGHEAGVLEGMAELIRRDRPTLIVETSSAQIEAALKGQGYSSRRLPGSSNLLFTIG